MKLPLPWEGLRAVRGAAPHAPADPQAAGARRPAALLPPPQVNPRPRCSARAHGWVPSAAALRGLGCAQKPPGPSPAADLGQLLPALPIHLLGLRDPFPRPLTPLSKWVTHDLVLFS